VDQFADATRDHQWIHVDRERAARSRFGGTIVHGYLILSLGPWLVRQVLDLSDVTMSINYGLDRARFISPVRVGEALQLRVNVTDVRVVSDEVARLHIRYTFERTSPVEPVCVADVISQLQFAGSDAG
jgi:acyl dehydratase